MRGRREFVYHTLLDSFVLAKEEAKSFTVAIDVITGTSVISSPIPIDEFATVQTQIQEALETRMPVTVWHRINKMIHTVPHANIARVVFTFA